jgi:hypothetical protein
MTTRALLLTSVIALAAAAFPAAVSAQQTDVESCTAQQPTRICTNSQPAATQFGNGAGTQTSIDAIEFKLVEGSIDDAIGSFKLSLPGRGNTIVASRIKHPYGRCPGVKNTRLLRVTGCGFVGDDEYPALHKFQVGFVSKAKAPPMQIAGFNFSGGYVMPAAALTVTGPTMLAPGYCPNSPSCPGADD